MGKCSDAPLHDKVRDSSRNCFFGTICAKTCLHTTVISKFSRGFYSGPPILRERWERKGKGQDCEGRVGIRGGEWRGQTGCRILGGSLLRGG